MRQIGIALVLCLQLTVALRSWAVNNSKLSSYVRQLVSTPTSAGSRTLAATPAKGHTLTAFLRIDTSIVDDICNTYGCRIYAQTGDIVIASIPIDCLGALSEHPSVHRIEANPSASLTMDTTAVIVGADKVYNPPLILPHPFTGQGVVVGIMDVGFDLTHPNFYDQSATNYRIGAFWDQLSRDTVGSTLPVGRDFTGYETVRAQLHSTDGLIQTHGTHTLGIAAGSGYQSLYRGIAFDADICLVSNAVSDDIELIDSADYYKYTSATDALGFKYIFDYADRQGKPCVASFSEGYPPYLDEEDCLYAAFLDSLTAIPGHILVASAGNEGYAKTYMEKPTGIEAAGAFLQASSKTALYRIKANGAFGLSVYAYNEGIPSHELHFHTDSVQPDSVLYDILISGNDTCFVTFDGYPSDFSTDSIYNLAFTATKPLSQLPYMAMVIEGADCYAELFGSSTYALTSNAVDPRWNAAETSHNIHAPACFPSVISVGSTVHRTGFTNYKGKYCDYSNGCTIGQRSPYSSTGPSMTGALKPNVMAPGDNVISSYSSYYLEAKPNASDINSDVEHFQFGDRTYAWNANTGTSMACPVVAGVIALWLQAKPNLTTQEVMEALSHTCRQPDPSLPYPNTEYGHGEIDAYRGLLYLLGIDKIRDISHHLPKSLRITIRDKQLFLHTDELPTAPLRISIYNIGGTRIYQTTIRPDCLHTLLPPLPAGVYAVQVDCDVPNFRGSQLISIKI